MAVHKVYVNGREITLSDKRHYIAEGGQGRIYAVKNTAFKIYPDQSKPIPKGKIRELSVLDHPSIIRPVDPVYNSRHALIGYTMAFCSRAIEMCRLFNTVFLNDNSIPPEVLQKLVENMREIIAFIHGHGCLIVDGNEKNYMVSTDDYSVPSFIDVDAWQTKSFKADAYTPMSTDPNIKMFDELSDWFSFGIVVCKIFIGIHPFRGTHPGYDKKDVALRMKDHVSIFNKDTRLPISVRDRSFIPAAYIDWMSRMFENGERIPPPTSAGLLKVVQVIGHLIESTGSFRIDLLKKYESKIIKHKVIQNKTIVQTDRKLYIDGVGFKMKARGTHSARPDVVLSPKSLIPIVVSIDKSRNSIPLLTFSRIKSKSTAEVLSLSLASDSFMVVGNQVYSLLDGDLTEIEISEVNGRPIPSVIGLSRALQRATKMFDGLLYQKVFGKSHLIIPHRRQGKSYCEIKPIPELDDYRVVDGKHDNGVCMLIGERRGSYDRIILRFGEDYQDYDVRIIEDIDQPTLNFVVLDTGIAVSIDEHAEMEVFLAKPGSAKLKHVRDKEIKTEMLLTKDGGTLMFYQGSHLYRIKMIS